MAKPPLWDATVRGTSPTVRGFLGSDSNHRIDHCNVRIRSIDIVRGAVMVLMALDHVRVYAGVPAGGPEPGVFFTRWITHFCAPAFVFLAGTSAYLRRAGHLARHGGASSPAAIGAGQDARRERAGSPPSADLFLRGLWLIFLELTLLRFGWTFNFDYANFTFAGVIWVIGCSMIALGALSYLPAAVVGAIGVAIIVLHNAFAGALGDNPLLYGGGEFPLGGLNVVVLYTLIPWIGVMAAGYGSGAIVQRKRACIAIGAAAIVLFIVLRATNLYGNPWPWEGGVLAFLNTAKYPASLQFLLMTLGPVILVLPFLENARGRVARWLEVFGRVPFFFYVLHIPLIHLIAVLISVVRTPESTGWLFANHPMRPPEVPDGYRWSLPLLYLVTAFVVTLLYFPSRWFAEVKATKRSRWMSFL